MSLLNTRVVRDAADIDIAIIGALDSDDGFEEVILEPPKFKDSPATAKLTGIFHSIQDGVLITLYWEGEDDHTLMMPLEGRGVLDLTRFGGLENPRLPGWTGNVVLKAERTKPGKRHFTLSLEFSKQRG